MTQRQLDEDVIKMYMLNSSASKAKQDFPYFLQTLTTYVLPPITVAFAEP
jgi:hypothetical protein